MPQEKLGGIPETHWMAVQEEYLEKPHLIWPVWGLYGGWRKVGRVVGTQGCCPLGDCWGGRGEPVVSDGSQTQKHDGSLTFS